MKNVNTLLMAGLFIILTTEGCTNAVSSDLKSTDGFIEGVWFDHLFVDKLKQGGDSFIYDYLHFPVLRTSIDRFGVATWSVPNDSGILYMYDGKWYDEGMPLLEFQIVGRDTFAKYWLASRARVLNDSQAIARYQKIPNENPDSNKQRRMLDFETWIYDRYYLAGTYKVLSPGSESFEVTLTGDGEILGMSGYKKYHLHLGNTFPTFTFESLQDLPTILETTPTGFQLFVSSGFNSEIEKGGLLFEFVRTSKQALSPH